jgi:hypothetical protein
MEEVHASFGADAGEAVAQPWDRHGRERWLRRTLDLWWPPHQWRGERGEVGAELGLVRS